MRKEPNKEYKRQNNLVGEAPRTLWFKHAKKGGHLGRAVRRSFKRADKQEVKNSLRQYR